MRFIALLIIYTVPIVVVFTKFDYLVANEEMEIMNGGPDIEDDVIEALAIERANALFKKLCAKQLDGLGHAISHTKVSGELHCAISFTCHLILCYSARRISGHFGRID